VKEKSLRSKRYAKFVYWTRKSHSWIGLWGALLGVVFGVSGIWLNHRAELKLPPVAQLRSQTQLLLPEPVPTTSEAMAVWLQETLHFNATPTSVRVELSKPVAWESSAVGYGVTAEDTIVTPSTSLRQPERWLFQFGGPAQRTQIEYWKGSTSIRVSTVSNGLLATLNNLHKGVGLSIAWILLADSIAVSLIFLSLSGVILWVQMNRRRVVGVCIVVVSLGVTLLVIGVRL